MPKKYCPYCLPTKRKHHFPFHFEYYFEKAKSPITKLRESAFQSAFQAAHQSRSDRTSNYLWGLILEFLSWFRIITFTSNPDETKLCNLVLIFFKEAKQRNIDIKVAKVFGRIINEFKFYYEGKRYYFESIPLAMQKPHFDIDNKNKVKVLLQKQGIPVPKGRVFISTTKAAKFAENIGYPVVVKPVTGSLSWHVVCPVNTANELQQALKIAKKYRPDFIVEEFIEGELHRAAIVGQKHIFVSKKEKANVVGDGISTIQTLIEQKNQDDRRGPASKKNTTLYEICIDEFLKQRLAEKGLNLGSVLPENEKVELHNKIILSCGCDIINLTDKVHPENNELFLKIAKLLGTNLVGIDILCSDITMPYTEQKFAVIEANSLPHIDMHQCPSHGPASPVAEKIWDVVLEKLNNKRS